MSFDKDLLKDQDFVDYLVERLGSSISSIGKQKHCRVQILDGNMNRVRRISVEAGKGSKYSFIIKQAPSGGALCRFPSVRFAENRLSYEYRWYQFVCQMVSRERQSEFGKFRTPHIYSFDETQRVLIMEDLGERTLSSSISESSSETLELISSLGSFIGQLQSYELQAAGDISKVSNDSAEYNRNYVFKFHLDNPELVRNIWQQTLPEPSIETEKSFKRQEMQDKIKLQESFFENYHTSVKPILNELCTKMKESTKLVYSHGDLHPDSLMVQPDSKLIFIDAELSDSVHPGYDIGTLCAHLIAHSAARSKESIRVLPPAKRLVSSYLQTMTDNSVLDSLDKDSLLADIERFTGAELLRRLIGPASFSCQLSEENRSYLLKLSINLLKNKDEIFRS